MFRFKINYEILLVINASTYLFVNANNSYARGYVIASSRCWSWFLCRNCCKVRNRTYEFARKFECSLKSKKRSPYVWRKRFVFILSGPTISRCVENRWTICRRTHERWHCCRLNTFIGKAFRDRRSRVQSVV